MRSVLFFTFIGLTVLNQLQAAELDQVGGNKLQGTLVEIKQNQITMQLKSDSKSVPAVETISIDLDHARLPWKKTGMVILANNDRILGELVRSEEEFLLIKMNLLPGQPEWRVPLETVTTA